MAAPPISKADDHHQAERETGSHRTGQGTGYSGIEHPLFFKDNTRMFYGDAKASVDKLLPMID